LPDPLFSEFVPENSTWRGTLFFAYLPLQDVNEKEFHRQFDTNVLGLLLTSKRAAKQFGERGGCIIDIGPVASTLTPPASSIYAATKSAVDAITRVPRPCEKSVE